MKGLVSTIDIRPQMSQAHTVGLLNIYLETTSVTAINVRGMKAKLKILPVYSLIRSI